MKVHETEILGSFIIEPEFIQDERGFFAEVYNWKEMANYGIVSDMIQWNISFNKKAGTVRGMHYQQEPSAEDKTVRCTAGSIHDIILDLRSWSKTYMKWTPIQLTAENRHMLYIPKGVAHGYQTLEDNTEVCYQVSQYYHPEAARVIKWDRLDLCIKWPLPVSVISEKDKRG